MRPEVVFGLDTRLFARGKEESVDWEKLGGGEGWHGDEVETRGVRRGGRKGKERAHGHEHGEHHHEAHRQHHPGHHHEDHHHEDHHYEEHHHEDHHGKHQHEDSKDDEAEPPGEVDPLSRELLEAELAKLNFEIYRGTFSSPPHLTPTA